jgi:hypothetical protein
MVEFLRTAALAFGFCITQTAHALSPAPTTWPAGDAWTGKALYLAPSTAYAGNLSCGAGNCHGSAGTNATDPLGKVGRGANNPALINNAILSGKMTNAWLKAMTAQQLADVAAFIGNPAVTGPISAPKAALSVASLAFGSATVGAASAAQTVTLSNSGTAPLTLTSLVSSSTAFKITGGTCSAGGSVAAAATCTVTMTFNPVAAGTASGTLTIAHNASPTTSTVALSGSGTAAAAPVAGAAPASLTFASTTVGSTSPAQTVTLSNTGSAALALGTIANSNAAFVIGGGSCAAGGSVAAGASCTVTLAFKPTAAGAATGALTFTHNASPATTTVALSGTGAAAAPTASLTPTMLTFAQVIAGTSSNQTVTLSNTGTAPLTIGTITLAGAQAAEFARAAAGTCANGAVIAVGSNCTVLVNFTPTTTGARSASLSITHNAAGSPSTVTLNGTGTSTPQPVVAVNNNALTFAAQPLASTSAAQTITISNPGQATLLLSAVGLSGTHSADYSLGGTCVANASIAVGASCSLVVRFAPTALGTRSATVTLTSNTSPVTIGLTGTAVAAAAPAVALAPNSVDFGMATVGAAALSRTVVLTNTGTAALSVASITVTGAGFSGTHDCGTSVAAGASCTLTLAFAPASAAALTGQVGITSNAAGSPHNAALSGTGVLASMAVLAWSGTASAAFADTPIGSISTPAVLTLSNQGPGSASLNSISLGGANAAEFLTGGTCTTGASLAANASCTVTVALAPAQVGPRAAILNVVSNGSAPAPVALGGNGVLSAQQLLGVSTTTVNFPPAAQGQAVTPVPLTVTNTGTAPVTVTALTLTSGAFSAAPASGTLPTTLAPAQALDVNVSLDPAAAAPGNLTDTLTVMTDTAGLSRSLEVRASVSASATPETTNVGGGGFGATLAWLSTLALLALWRVRKAG